LWASGQAGIKLLHVRGSNRLQGGMGERRCRLPTSRVGFLSCPPSYRARTAAPPFLWPQPGAWNQRTRYIHISLAFEQRQKRSKRSRHSAALRGPLPTHPNGSALGVIGHIDRAWSFSMQASNVPEAQIGTFRNTLGFVLSGDPVGNAIRGQFGARFAALSTALASATSPVAPAAMHLSDRDLVAFWLERNDAQNYVVLGDPAVRIRTDAFA